MFYFYLTYTLTITDIQCLFDVRCNKNNWSNECHSTCAKGREGGGEGMKGCIHVHSIMHLDFPEPFLSPLSGKTTALIASSNTCFKPF